MKISGTAKEGAMWHKATSGKTFLLRSIAFQKGSRKVHPNGNLQGIVQFIGGNYPVVVTLLISRRWDEVGGETTILRWRSQTEQTPRLAPTS
jgi:hypothetical protein